MIKNQKKLIVSLTSFPEAIPYAVKAVKSILEGSLQPDKIVLYLDSDKFPSLLLPKELENLKKECPIFEVRFNPVDMRSYKKLIPALKDFPDDVIVTIDDDIHYYKDLLKKLVKVHKRFPESIIAHRVRRIEPGKPYKTWRKYKWYDFIFKRYHFSHFAMQTGVGGVLYPPHSLDESMLDPEVFMKLAPTTDDVWFWAAAVSKGTYVIPVPFGKSAAKGIGKPEQISLRHINLNPEDDKNRKAFEKIVEYYPKISKRLGI